jgi:hypothetical protein
MSGSWRCSRSTSALPSPTKITTVKKITHKDSNRATEGRSKGTDVSSRMESPNEIKRNRDGILPHLVVGFGAELAEDGVLVGQGLRRHRAGPKKRNNTVIKPHGTPSSSRRKVLLTAARSIDRWVGMAGRCGGEEETVVDGGALCVSALQPRGRRGSRWMLVGLLISIARVLSGYFGLFSILDLGLARTNFKSITNSNLNFNSIPRFQKNSILCPCRHPS